MMQITINIEKKHFYAIVLVLCLMGGGAVFAYNTGSNGVPSQMGHSFDEVGGGVTLLGDVNCNPHVAGDCVAPTDIEGVTFTGTPVDGVSLVDITQKDINFGGNDGGALKVKGHATFEEGNVYLLNLSSVAPMGYTHLCIWRGISPDSGKITLCP